MNLRGFITSWLAGCGAAVVAMWSRTPAAAGMDAYRIGERSGAIPEPPEAAGPVACRPGTEFVCDFTQFGDGSRVVGMTTYQDSVFVATERRVYRIQTVDGFPVVSLVEETA